MNDGGIKLDYYKLGGVFFCLCICLPYVILRDNSYITIHDFLDSTIGHIRNIIICDKFFDTGAKIPLLEGVSRLSIAFTTPFEIKALLFTLFTPYWAIVVNIVLVKLLAFWGMYKLLDDSLLRGRKMIALSVSVLYTLIPFYVDYGISAAGIPLLAYAFIGLYYKKNVVRCYAIVLLYAMYSCFALSGIFVCFLLATALFAMYIKEGRFFYHLFFSLLILSSVYLMSNGEMIINFFDNTNVVSHRVEWVNDSTFLGQSMIILDELMISQYHAGAFLAAPIVLAFVIVYLCYFRKDRTLKYYMMLLILLIMLISIGAYVRLLPFQIFGSFQFDRFYFLYPAMVFVLLAKVTEVLIKELKHWIAYPILFISLGCIIINSDSELVKNGKILLGADQNEPTYHEFFDKDLFKKMASDANIPQDYSVKVVSLGLFPSIAEYNGFWCLDTYTNTYPLKYKHQFRRVISGELKKSASLKRYYDGWGSRCYVFSAELGKKYLYGKKDKKKIDNLDINTKTLKDMGCEYIISAVDILNYKDLKLEYVGNYTTEKSYWEIKLYRLV